MTADAGAAAFERKRFYRQRCIETIGRDVSLGVDWMFWSFPWSSPETRQLFAAMEVIERRLFKRYLETIRKEEIAGSIVEFGVYRGESLRELVLMCEGLDLSRPVYGFDSFEGLPETSQTNDLDCFEKGQFAAEFDEVKSLLEVDRKKNVQLLRGWFDETLAKADVQRDPGLEKIAFARIDCDIYDSAVTCLQFIQNRLADGAFLIFDDWSHKPDLGETKAFFEFCDRVGDRLKFEHLASLGLGALHLRVRHIIE